MRKETKGTARDLFRSIRKRNLINKAVSGSSPLPPSRRKAIPELLSLLREAGYPFSQDEVINLLRRIEDLIPDNVHITNDVLLDVLRSSVEAPTPKFEDIEARLITLIQARSLQIDNSPHRYQAQSQRVPFLIRISEIPQCPHGVPVIKICAICDPEKHRDYS